MGLQGFYCRVLHRVYRVYGHIGFCCRVGGCWGHLGCQGLQGSEPWGRGLLEGAQRLEALVWGRGLEGLRTRQVNMLLRQVNMQNSWTEIRIRLLRQLLCLGFELQFLAGATQVSGYPCKRTRKPQV